MGEAVPPSKVIHIRNLGQDVSEQDLHQLAQTFGAVQKVVLMRQKNQALVEMPDLAAAMNMVQFYTAAPAQIRNRNVYLGYSSHQQLTTHERNEGNGNAAPMHQHQHQRGEAAPNRVLLVTVHSPLYPINVDVLHQVFSPHGSVEKIVLFQKAAGLQALVQYGQQQSAVVARTQLQGRNIYDGCCTLEIQFSNLPELQVHANNERTRDYTNNALPEQAARAGPGGNLQGSLFGEGNNNNMYGAGHMRGFPPPPGGLGLPGPFQHHMNPMASAAAAASLFGGQLPPGLTATNGRCTLLVTNVNTEFVNDDKLFNLFSNYGNVLRIKFLHSKPDHALVEMAEGIQAEMAVLYCKGVILFGKKLEVNYSKHPTISPTPDLKDYALSPLNRFSRHAAKNYRHCCAPTKMLHVSSLPHDVTEPMVVAHLTGFGTIVGSKMIEKDGKRQVLVQFDTPEAALDTLVSKHGSELGSATIRLAFSKTVSL